MLNIQSSTTGVAMEPTPPDDLDQRRASLEFRVERARAILAAAKAGVLLFAERLKAARLVKSTAQGRTRRDARSAEAVAVAAARNAHMTRIHANQELLNLQVKLDRLNKEETP